MTLITKSDISITFPPSMADMSANYPGIRGVFVEEQGTSARPLNWSIFNGDYHIRAFSVTSKTEDSLLSRIKIVGYKDGNVELQVCYDYKDRHKIKNFLENNGIEEAEDRYKFNFLQTKQYAKKLFDIVQNNNTLPSDKIPFMRTLVERQNWLEFTPLKPGEVIHGGLGGWSPWDLLDESSSDDDAF